MSTASPPVRFECPDAGALAGDAPWWDIYDEAFPLSEREPRDVILAGVRDGRTIAVRARQGGDTIGLATVHLLRSPPAVFLVYLAVARPSRGRGIGGPLLEYSWQAGAGGLGRRGLAATGMVWEVDIPSRSTSEEESRRRGRRIEFFRRLGGTILPRPYAQPPLRGIEPVPMHLMYRPAEGTGRPGPATTEALLRAIYFEKYGEANGIASHILEDLLQTPPPE